MRVPYLWIKEYLKNLSITPEEAGDKLTYAGLEVDGIEDFNPGISGIIAGSVKEVKSHPDNDKLSVLKVDTGEKEYRTIICGARNVKVDQCVFTAIPGSILPGDVKISEVDFKGIVSQGMLCSGGELGLDLVQEEEGILVMDENVLPGTDLIEHLEINDKIITLSLTPNRADCLGLIGVAFELAAITGDKVELPPENPEELTEDIKTLASVDIEDSNLCRRYTARIIKDVKIKPSPLWMQIKLLKAGIRPINNIVDITNYVMWEYGQPLHAFDLSSLKEGAVIIRRALPGEAIVTIDGEKRLLTEDNLVIADREKPIALAGVMGGENTEIATDTRDVLLESAYFNPVNIRRTARSLGLLSEASQRFEKGVNPDGVLSSQNRAALLMSEFAGGKVLKGVIDKNPMPFEVKKIDLDTDRVCKVLGVEVGKNEIENILNRLGFSYEHKSGAKEVFEVQIPLRRPDISIEEDLFEEIARLFGYDNIPVVLPSGELLPSRENLDSRIDVLLRDTLIGYGFYETITYSFINPSFKEKFGLPEDHPFSECIPLQNPISEDQGVLRTTLLPGLLNVLKYNFDYRESTQLLFEKGAVFIPKELPLKELPHEKHLLSFAVTGKVPEKSWNFTSKDVDFFFLKGIIDKLDEKVTKKRLVFEKTTMPFLHPGRAALIKMNNEIIGFMGELHPDVARAYDFKQKIFIAEIDLDDFRKNANIFNKFTQLPRYPASLRDLAVIVPQNVASGEIESSIRDVGGKVIERISLFDVYEGDPVPKGYRNLAYSIVYRSREKTLTDSFVSEIHEKIEKTLQENLGVNLRK